MITPLVGIVMGSKSDWSILENAMDTLDDLGITYEAHVISAHRTPDSLIDYAEKAESRGLEVIIAGAGGAAALPGILAAKTLLPVLGVPMPSEILNGVDSLLSMISMPSGIPVGTLGIGKAGAINAALLAAAILGNRYHTIREQLAEFRNSQSEKIRKQNEEIDDFECVSNCD